MFFLLKLTTVATHSTVCSLELACSNCPLSCLHIYSVYNSDAASGKEMSDSYEGTASGGKGDGKPRKHHRKSARTRSRQEKTSKPKLSMLNVRHNISHTPTFHPLPRYISNVGISDWSFLLTTLLLACSV